MKNKDKENISIAKAFYRALSNGDQGHAQMLLDPDIEWLEPATEGLYFSGPHRGRQVVFEEVIEPTHDKIAEFEWKPKKFFAVRDKVVVLARETGRGRITDLKLDAPTVHMWTIANGKALRFEGVHDVLKWKVALGQTSAQPEQLAA
jgi:ketosteroid isomerase-like protein